MRFKHSIPELPLGIVKVRNMELWDIPRQRAKSRKVILKGGIIYAKGKV
jgi:hypothetical protein